VRLPSFSRGFTSFMWGFWLGLFVWIFLLSVDIGGGAAFIYGFLAGLAIFFYVLLFGGEQYRRP
jgi:hypothetical protein